MTTQPTNNPVPSESPRDLKFNAGKIDEFVTSMALQYIDRFGNSHYTIEGLKQLVLQQIYNLGWNLVGSFQGGATLNAAGDIIQDETTGIWYRWDDLSTLPKEVPVGSTPASSGGVGEGKWQPVDVSDVLRKDLAKADGEKLIGECQTIAALRLIEPTYDKQRITLREHTAGTGKGGGQFRAVLSGGLFTDNNGTIIKTSGGAAWLRINADILNTFMFGGVGDGVANETQALQNQFNAATLSGASRARIPAGVWLSSGVTVTANSLQIEGDGKYPGTSGTTIRALAANTVLFTFTGYGTRLTNMQLDGYENTNSFGAYATCTGVNFSRPGSADVDSFVDSLTLTNLKYGTRVTGRNLTQEDILFSHCIFPTTLTAYIGEQFRGHVIRRSRFHSCGGQDANSNTTDTSRAGSVCVTITPNSTVGTAPDNYAGNIIIDACVADAGTFQFLKGSFSRGSMLTNLSMFRVGGAGAIMIDINNAQTVSDPASEAILLSNIVLASDLNYSATTVVHPENAIRLQNVKGAVLSSMSLSKMLGHGIQIATNCETVSLHNIQLKNPGFAASTTGAVSDAINIDSSCSLIQIGLISLRCTQASPQLRSVVYCTGSAHWDAKDFVGSTAVISLVNEGSTGRVSGDWSSGAIASKEKVVRATAVSTIPEGNYAIGDRIIFTTPPATGTAYDGARCVTAGTKSTAVWRNYGALS